MRRDRATILLLMCALVAAACGTTGSGEARLRSEVVDAVDVPVLDEGAVDVAVTAGTMFWFWAPW